MTKICWENTHIYEVSCFAFVITNNAFCGWTKQPSLLGSCHPKWNDNSVNLWTRNYYSIFYIYSIDYKDAQTLIGSLVRTLGNDCYIYMILMSVLVIIFSFKWFISNRSSEHENITSSVHEWYPRAATSFVESAMGNWCQVHNHAHVQFSTQWSHFYINLQ